MCPNIELEIALFFVIPKESSNHVSPRRFSAFAGRVPDRNHAECRVFRVIALHERK
jgi:hypothetical protein